MKQSRRGIIAASAAVIAMVCILFLIRSQPVEVYTDAIKVSAEKLVIHKNGSEDPLWQRIEEEAYHFGEPPENARLDPVWKAIPGYNGIEVDLEATYELALMQMEVPLQLIVREKEPEIQLEDLPPMPIYRGNPHKPMAGLLINVAWGEEYLPALLDILAREGVKATFFLSGSWLEEHQELAKLIRDQGHEIGNHAYTHPAISKLSRSAMQEQIQRTNELCEHLLGVTPQYFAPPGGDFNQAVVEVAEELGMYTILWTLDTVDWQKPSRDLILQRILPEVSNGNLILMHPTPSTVQSLEPIIQGIREKGLQLGTASEVLSSKRVGVKR